MKYNLKNRPRPIETHPLPNGAILELWDDREITQWFEGFEKELREMCREEKVGNEISYGEYKRLKEILGDDSRRTVKEHKGPSEVHYKDPENYDSPDSSTSDD